MDRFKHLKKCLESSNKDGYILELGVYKGVSINYLAGLTEKYIYGFDSWVGLPEDWDRGTTKVHSKNIFYLEKPPKVANNIILISGWFKDTIPKWKQTYKDNISLLHIDCDIYTSTIEALTILDDRIVSGTIIIFDELFNYPNWRNHEWKALNEWAEKYNREYSWLYKLKRHQASIRVEK